jgi:hypothetical protein
MATQKQTQAARRNIVKAKDAARRKRTLANLPAATRRDLGHQAARARSRGGEAGHGYENRPANNSTRWRRGATSADARRWVSGS